jgi:hypothetical protein
MGKKMKVRTPDKYATAALLLIVTAAVLIWMGVSADPAEQTAAVLILSGLVCALSGIFTLTFSGGEPVDAGLLGILPAAGSITFCCLAHHLDIKGNAHFLPQRLTGESRVMQFNPVSDFVVSEGYPKGSFRTSGPPGLVTSPFCDPLIQDLKKKNELVVPYEREDLTLLLRETIEDVFRLAPRVSARWSDNTVAITFHHYPGISGCRVVARESPRCCTISPCPVCSLCGALIAEGLEKVVALEQCSIVPSSRNVVAVFSFLP